MKTTLTILATLTLAALYVATAVGSPVLHPVAS